MELVQEILEKEVGLQLLLDKKNQSNISGSEKKTTNNRMELMAAIMALKKIKKNQKLQFILTQDM